MSFEGPLPAGTFPVTYLSALSPAVTHSYRSTPVSGDFFLIISTTLGPCLCHLYWDTMAGPQKVRWAPRAAPCLSLWAPACLRELFITKLRSPGEHWAGAGAWPLTHCRCTKGWVFSQEGSTECVYIQHSHKIKGDPQGPECWGAVSHGWRF